MSLILQPPWTRQPQGAVEVDWSNPLTRGLQCALSPYFEHVKQRRPTYSGTVVYATRASGKSLKGNNAGLAYASVSGVGDPVTIMWVGAFSRTANANFMAALGASTGNQIMTFQLSNNFTNNRVIIRQTNAGAVTFRDYGANASTTSAEKVVLCGVITGTSSIDAYWNGQLDNGTLTTGSTGNNSGFDTAALGGVQRATNGYADTGNDGALFCYWNRALTAREIAAISANPWQIFTPVKRTLVSNLSVAAADAFQSDAFQTNAFQTSAATGVNHATSGALTGPGSTVTGAAARFRAFATTGALIGPGSTVTGSANHAVLHATTGALTGPGSTLSGSASRFRAFATSGALTGQGSTLSGSASRFRTFNTTGDLIGQGATVIGAANRFRAFDTSGVLNGPGAIIVGSAARSAVAVTHDTTGALVGPGAIINGQAEYISLYPDPSVVLAGVQYGPGGIYVGTLTVGVGQRIIRLRSFTESD